MVGHDGFSQWLEARRLYRRYLGHDRTGPVQYDFVFGNGAFKSCIGVCMIAIRFGSDSHTLICQDSTGSIALAFPDFIALAVLHWLC